MESAIVMNLGGDIRYPMNTTAFFPSLSLHISCDLRRDYAVRLCRVCLCLNVLYLCVQHFCLL